MSALPQSSRYLHAVPLLSKYGLYRGLMFVAVGLALAMALFSATDRQVHHDEYDHVNAARFYFEHWLPPRVGDPRALDSYSLYGMSYLDQWDVVYPLAGKFAKLIRPVVSNEVIALRLFNVALFLVLACIAFARRDDILAFVLLLTSSQIWYVFSYVNGDALPLFLSFLAALALTSPRSLFNDHTRSTLVRYLPLGICIGLLVISKKSFWTFGLFAFCCAIWLDSAEGERPRTWYRLVRSSGLLAAIVLATAFPRIGYDFIVNGTPSQKASMMVETADALALPYFKPSTNMRDETNLRRKGVSLAQMMQPPYRWAEVSAITAFGAYNYTALRAKRSHFAWIFGAYGAFLIYLIATILRRGDVNDRAVLFGGLTVSLLVVGLSVYHSWTSDFQPQGRYLFGIFAILAVILARGKRLVRPLAVNAFLLFCFFWSVHSFCAIGLSQIPDFKDVSEINSNFRRP